jgi:cystathionine beta-synthase
MAIWAAVKGYRCIFTISDKQSPDKIALLRNFGAKVVICPTEVAPDDPKSYYSVAQRIAEESSNALYIDQYNDILNREAHYKTTAPEIWEQTGGALDIVFFPAGTGGLVSGCSQFFKEKLAGKIQTIAVDAKGSVLSEYSKTGEIAESKPYKLEGVGADFIPKNFDFSVIDSWVEVSDKDAFLTARELLKQEGIYAGGSSGMAVFGALQFLKNISSPKKVLIVLCDSGTRYVNKIYDDEWMENNHFFISNNKI